MHESEIVEVYSAADESEAYVVKNLLEDAGIKSQVVNDGLIMGAWSTTSATFAPRVWVMHDDEPRAREIIENWKDEQQAGPPPVQAAPWKCPNCGEEVQADFEMCWNCQHVRAVE